MADTNPAATTTMTHWAVIIGVNNYPKSDNLRGSEEGATPVDIVILTATTPSSPSSGLPIEERKLWPTRANVVSALKRVFEKAQPGDFVHLHYSGHGTKLPSDAPPGPNSTGELALVLSDDNKNGNSYLRGSHFAGVLRKMVEKGLLVTLVLDCCFSGSVVRSDDRHGFDIRYSKYNPDIDTASSQKHTASLLDWTSTLRDSRVKTDWLVNPDGYIILSACGPYEIAHEIEIEGEGRRGALTYFLHSTLSALGKSRTAVTHQSLHEYLCTRFHASWPQQTPMRYGNKNLSFFGKLITAPDTSFISVYRTANGRLRLRAGKVHGVDTGDEFALYPFDVSERTPNPTEEHPMILRVETLHGLESDLVEVRPTPFTKQITTGWKARLMTSVAPRRIRVRLAANIDNHKQWKEAAERLRFLKLCVGDEGGEPCVFNVVINGRKEYEIVDTLYEGVVGLPAIRLDSTRAMEVSMDILQHLAMFKFFEGLENRLPKTSFHRSFSLTPNSAIGASGIFEVTHGHTWGFTIANSCDKPLYMAIFNLSPSWGIVNLVSVSGGDDYWVVPSKAGENNGKKVAEMLMEVPDFLKGYGKTQCEDIMKVFITSKPTSFSTIELPKINLNRSHLGKSTRDTNNVSKFLSELRVRYRGQTDMVEDDWATQNFIIRTSIE